MRSKVERDATLGRCSDACWCVCPTLQQPCNYNEYSPVQVYLQFTCWWPLPNHPTTHRTHRYPPVLSGPRATPSQPRGGFHSDAYRRLSGTFRELSGTFRELFVKAEPDRTSFRRYHSLLVNNHPKTPPPRRSLVVIGSSVFDSFSISFLAKIFFRCFKLFQVSNSRLPFLPPSLSLSLSLFLSALWFSLVLFSRFKKSIYHDGYHIAVVLYHNNL